jgi:hypothetical protein
VTGDEGVAAGARTYRVAAYLDSVTGFSGMLTVEPDVVRLRVRSLFAALRRRPLGPPLDHPGPDITLVRLRWELLPWHRAALLLHKPRTRAYVPLTRGRAARLAADLRAAGFDVREVTVRGGFAATGLLESLWLRHAVERGRRGDGVTER